MLPESELIPYGSSSFRRPVACIFTSLMTKLWSWWIPDSASQQNIETHVVFVMTELWAVRRSGRW